VLVMERGFVKSPSSKWGKNQADNYKRWAKEEITRKPARVTRHCLFRYHVSGSEIYGARFGQARVFAPRRYAFF
jgi:hypothetical protein